MSNNQLRYIILGGIFLIPFVPLVVSKSLFFPFITGKAFVFRFLVEIIFLAWVVLALRDESYRPKFSWILLSVMTFLVAIGVADILSENPFKSFWSNYERMEGFLALLHFGAFFVVLGSVLRTEEVWNKLIATSIGASSIMAVYSFFQIAGKITINQGGVRVDGTFGNASYLGIYMVFHIFLAVLLFLRSKSDWQKILLSLVTLANLAVLYYTATRGAILGLIGGLLITLICLGMWSEKGTNIRKVAGVTIFTLLILIGSFFVFRNTGFVKNSPVLSRFASLSVSEIKTQGRFYVWPIAYKGFLERPFFGWGQEGFNYVFNKYYDPRMYKQEPWFDRTHNIVLDWLVSGGLVGFLSYVSIFFALLYCIKKTKENYLSKEDKAVVVGLLAAYVFHNFFVFDQIGSYIMFFIILAYVHSHSETRVPDFWKKFSDKCKVVLEKENLKPIFESIVIVLAVIVFYFVIYVPWTVNKNLLMVLGSSNEGKILTLEEYASPVKNYTVGFSEALEHISQLVISLNSNQTVPVELKQGLSKTIDDAFVKQLQVSPNDARYRLFYGLFLSRIGKYDESLKQLQIASDLSPKKQTMYFEVASNLMVVGKVKEALEVAKKAYELEPNFDEAKFIYGLVTLSSGDTKKASEILSSIPEDKLIYDDRFISILVQVGDFQKVVEVLNIRISREPSNLQHRMTLAAAYLQANRRQEAVRVLEEIIKLDPSFKERGEFFIKEIQAGRNP